MKTKEKFMMYVKIAERAEELGIYDGKRSTLLMDIESADEYFNMRLEDWLNADNFNFAHDVVGSVQLVQKRTIFKNNLLLHSGTENFNF